MPGKSSGNGIVLDVMGHLNNGFQSVSSVVVRKTKEYLRNERTLLQAVIVPKRCTDIHPRCGKRSGKTSRGERIRMAG